MGKDTVAHIWLARNIRRGRVETFKLSNDPNFEIKLVDVVGLYLDPPERAVGLRRAAHGLRAADAIHLATAVGAGADRFLTNNRADFAKSITEIDITYPEELPDPAKPSSIA